MTMAAGVIFRPHPTLTDEQSEMSDSNESAELADATTLAKKIAKLARIQLSENETQETAAQFANVVNYIHQLDQVDIPAGTEPFFGATESTNATRPDEVVKSFPREEILANAPKTDGEYYRVPPVFDN